MEMLGSAIVSISFVVFLWAASASLGADSKPWNSSCYLGSLGCSARRWR